MSSATRLHRRTVSPIVVPTTIVCSTTFLRTTELAAHRVLRRAAVERAVRHSAVARDRAQMPSRAALTRTCGQILRAGAPMPDAQMMTARRPLPYYLTQSAFATARADEFGVSRSRMRASDLQTPFRGVRSVGLDLDDLVHRCRA